MREALRGARLLSLAAAVALGGAAAAFAQTAAPADPAAPRRVTFAEAVAGALERDPGVREAAQAVLRAEALLTQARSALLPSLYAGAGTTVLDAARGFDGQVTQPRTQTALSATLRVPVLSAASWAERNRAADEVRIAALSGAEARRQVAVAAAQTYLGVIAAERQRDIAVRNLETARVLEEYARARLEAGGGSRLNHVRSVQERASAQTLLESADLAVRRAQEALGVVMFLDTPVAADGDPDLAAAPPPSSDAWLEDRPDVRLASAQHRAAERFANASWTLFTPTLGASFTPQYVTPSGLFEPARTWRALFQVQVPLVDTSLFGTKRLRAAERESALIRLDALKLQARSELRVAEQSVTVNERMVASARLASESAAEALRITQIAYRAGATSNIEVVQAQQGARNAEIGLAVAEDRLRLARLDRLVALGQFPQ
ncbi:MAG: TolC family protein [Vicinamibacteria bacterium]